MRLIPSFLSSVNILKPVSIEDDIKLAAKIASEDIAQSNTTILRAAYIKHMAEAKLKAHQEWAIVKKALLDSLHNGESNGKRN